MVVQLRPLSHVLGVLDGELGAFRVEDLGLALAVLDAAGADLNVGSYLCAQLQVMVL